MQPLDDEELSEHTGAAIAIGWQNLRFLAGPTTFLEAKGDFSAGNTPSSPWKRGDLRYYGFGYSGVTPVASYAGTCSAGYNGLGCPIGNAIPYFMAFDNPLIIRVYDYTGVRFNGTTSTNTIFELLGPTNSSPFRYSWWGELVVGSDTTGTTRRLQGQAVSNNVRLSTVDEPGSAVRNDMKFRFVSHTDPIDATLGILFENHWSGDFRYSVNQAFTSPDAYGVAPTFTSSEGFYALNVKSFWPLGQLHYQDLIVDDVSTAPGNFRWEVTTPTAVNAYNNFYAVPASDTLGYTRRNPTTGALVKPTSTLLTDKNWYRTHAYLTMGDWYPDPPAAIGANPTYTNSWAASGTASCSGATLVTNGVGCNGRYSTADGLFFVSYDPSSAAARFSAFSDTLNPADYNGDTDNSRYGVARISNGWNGLTNSVNIGDGRIYGVLINHIELRTRGI